jgi:HD superfamily phosphohydrolase
MKRIKDIVHGYISVGDLELSIIETTHFQRLRNIAQLSTTQMVYPCARHNRFEHSLGVYYLSKRIFDNVLETSLDFEKALPPNTTDILKKTLIISALLHDIGHYPFSHLGERFSDKDKIIELLEKNYGFVSKMMKDLKISKDEAIDDLKGNAAHELSSCLLVLNQYGDIIIKKTKGTAAPVDPYEVCAFILGCSFSGFKDNIWQYDATAHILNSPIDADRLDYIIRDNKTSGASLSSIDSERMIMAYTTCGTDLALSMNALSIIDSFLNARDLIFLWVCQHHKVVFSNALLMRMIDILLKKEKDLLGFEKIEEELIDDYDVICKIREKIRTGKAEPLLTKYYEMYSNRNFLGSCWKHIIDFKEKISNSAVKKDLLTDIKIRPDDVETYLVNKLSIEEHEVIVDTSDIKPFDIFGTSDIFLNYKGESRNIADLHIYQPRREYVTPIPFIYVPKLKIPDTLELLKKYNSRDLN